MSARSAQSHGSHGSHEQARRLLIRGFVASVTVNAVLGVWALLSGDFGETEGKVLATSFLVSAAMLSVLVNSGAIRRRVVWPVPVLASGVLVAGLLLLIVAMWAEIDGDTLPKLILSAMMIGGAGTLIALISLSVEPRSLLTVRTVHATFVGAALALSLVMLWSERGSDAVIRLLGVECVIAAALTLVIPVISRTRGSRGGDEPEAGRAGGAGYCPRCGATLASPVSCELAHECGSCGARFTVSMSSAMP